MVSRKQDLHTGRSVWRDARAIPVARQRLEADVTADVLIVGAGISGALIGEMLAADGHSVAIVDRRGPARGSTAASTALVQYEIDEPLTKLTRKIGAEAAMRAWRRSYQAVANLAARTQELGLEGEIRRRATLYLSGNTLDPAGLKHEQEARRTAGIETFFLAPAALEARFGIARRSALLSYGNLALDPRRLATGYLAAAIGNGAQLFTPADIVDLAVKPRSVTATTRHGPTIKAKTVVLATGYEFADIVPLEGHEIISTYAMATKPQRQRLWPEQCFIWEASDPYLYMRTTPDGRIIIGGEDEDFEDEERRDALIDRKIRRLGEKLTRLFPEVDVGAAYAWAGTFGTSTTGLPSIGRLPGRPNCWAVLGYGGNGITYSRIAAEIISSALAGRDDPDGDLYAFAGA